MKAVRLAALISVIIPLQACVGESGAGGAKLDAGIGVDVPLDKVRAQMAFPTTTDLIRRVIAPTCAAEDNECHSNEYYPDMATEANFWNLIGLRCNVGVGERTTIENRCEAQGDTLRITDGANSGFAATIGSVHTVTDDVTGEFRWYEITLESPVAQSQSGGSFELLRAEQAMPGLGGGDSLEAVAGQTTLRIMNANRIANANVILQGDENEDGIFGDSSGVIVRRGNARESYLISRLFGAETSRSRMPVNTNIDNPNEESGFLTEDEMYVLMSWINCMAPDDGTYSPIRYDCAANADNQGIW